VPGDESILIIVSSTCICTMFCKLINIYEKSWAGETEKPVTVLDLQVFWDTSKDTHHTQSMMCVLGRIDAW
jgi:hypothetical protein